MAVFLSLLPLSAPLFSLPDDEKHKVSRQRCACSVQLAAGINKFIAMLHKQEEIGDGKERRFIRQKQESAFFFQSFQDQAGEKLGRKT
jgi:hypothetical protein